MSTTSPDSLRELAAGYALGTLTADEAAQFEAAMAQSGALQRDVAEFREVNAMLASRERTAPDPALRGRLLSRIRDAKTATVPTTRRRGAPILSLALAATVLIAVAFGLRVRTLSDTVAQQDSVIAATEAALAERERTLNTLLLAESQLAIAHLVATGPDAPGIQLYVNRKSNTAVLHAFRLRPAPVGRIYQLWLMRDGVPVPSRTFNSDPDGHALVQAFSVPAGGGFSAAAVTLEPAGGSPAPTTAVLMFGRLTGP
jgi:anti-sigma-K factor RskA